jgi:hypothetical protein
MTWCRIKLEKYRRKSASSTQEMLEGLLKTEQAVCLYSEVKKAQ